jgi:hypothetical protein
MPSFQSVSPAFIVCVFFSLASFGQCQEAWSPKPTQSQRAEALVEYLNRAAIKLDCYFTIEEMPRGVDDWIESHDMRLRSQPDSIDELIELLPAELKGVHVYRSTENPAVIHVIDERLEKEKDYSLAKRVSVTFSGSLEKLVEKLQRTSPINLGTKMGGGLSGVVITTDCITEIHCSTRGTSARRVLTDWLPLLKYNRTLWVANTQRINGILETDVFYYGKFPSIVSKEENGEVAFDIVAPEVNGVIPFDYGEIAYRNNPDPDKEKVRVNLISQATTFIDERLHADKPLQVRWAMFYLGKRKAKAGIPVLLKYLDYRYTTCGVLEESYPAVRALTQIGKPAADAAFDELVGKDQSDLRVRLLTAVVRAVDGPKPARDRLEKALAGANGGAQKKRLELALKWLVDEKE